MKCPECNSDQISITNTRAIRNSNAIRRRRQCDRCGHRWTTQELSESLIAYYEKQLKRLQVLEPFKPSSEYERVRGKSRSLAWSNSETEQLLTMYFNDTNLTEIAEALNRSYTSISKRIQFLRKNNKLVKP